MASINGSQDREISLCVVMGVIIGRSWKKVLTRGAHLSASEREGEAPFQDSTCWAMGSIWSWAESLPRGLFLFIIIFRSVSFLFLISKSSITFPK
jgi:hypothetical protein